MLPAKGEGCSYRKGKEVVVDEPPMEAVKGKEALHSKSDRSKEEETSCKPNSECLPLLIHDMMLTHIFQWCPMTTSLLRRAVFGYT